ncbi:MAG: hypothetical protein ACRCW2_06015 [Cellulosilyticaceae bacterium]
MNKYSVWAIIGIILMGLSAFAACLSQVSMVITLGNIGILASIGIMSYGFSYWQP